MPVLGVVYCEDGYGCTRCGSHEDANVLTNVVHDLRCWGARTAWFNLKLRLGAPRWFTDPDAEGV